MRNAGGISEDDARLESVSRVGIHGNLQDSVLGSKSWNLLRAVSKTPCHA